MNIEEIKHRLSDSEHVYFSATEEETRYLLSVIEQQNNLLNVIDSMVDEMKKTVLQTDSGATRLILMETLIQKYSYYKLYPNEIQSYLKAIRGG